MRNYFTLDGVDSRTYGIYISGEGTYSAPPRAYNMIPIPGRNGDLVNSENRFSNGTYSYPAFISVNTASNVAAFRAWLMSLYGYKKLTDTYHPSEYRMVLFDGSFEPTVTALKDVASFDLSFNCKPQRFLTSGDTKTTKTANFSLTNPTLYESKPLLRVYGNGTLTIAGQTITIANAGTYTDIDCELMDAYQGATSRNNNITLSDYKFPVLKPGANAFTLGTGITKVEVTPRWWTL